jgi:hypothetical protein
MMDDISNDEWLSSFDLLQRRGSEGWELVLAVRLWEGRPVMTYIFKRRR